MVEASAPNARQRKPFFPRADSGTVTTITKAEDLPGPSTELGLVFDHEGAERPIDPWSKEVEESYFPPKPDEYATAPVPTVPKCLPDRYLRAFLAKNEKLRMSMVWYYTGGILEEPSLLFSLQEKACLAQEFIGWEYAVIGILDLNFFRRVVAVGGIPLGLYPRGETIASHTITWPSGSLFMLPNMMEDWRFRDHPIVTFGGLRAYSGAPLRLQDESGEFVALGSLCVASSSTQQTLTAHQQNRLLRLADWIVADIVHATRAKRQRAMRQMTDLIAQAETKLVGKTSEEPVVEILRTAFPDATISVQSVSSNIIQIEGREPVPVSELDTGSGIWEDLDYLDDFVAKSNHRQFPSDRVVRILFAKCDGISGPALLVVGRKSFPLVMDDIDAWFVRTCANILSQMWQKVLLTEALSTKDRFLRGVTHQLRTPIHGILGSADLLAEELRNSTIRRGGFSLPTATSQSEVSSSESPEVETPKPSVYIETIKATGRDLFCIVNSIITFSRWADIALETRSNALITLADIERELCKRIVTTVSGDTRYGAPLVFRHDTGATTNLYADLGLLGDTLAPLVLNAIQNTRQGIITVTASLHPDAQGQAPVLVVDVEDTGRGIASEHQQRIFEPYEKVDQDSHGAGLGLTLATKFSGLLNGAVTLVSSEPGRGSHFRATFNDLQLIPSGSVEQIPPLRSSLLNLPASFCILSDRRPSPLSEWFAKFLVQHGYAQSDCSAADSFIVLDSVPDQQERRASLSSVPPNQVAIILNPVVDAASAATWTSDNIVHVNGPFTTSKLIQALNTADALISHLPIEPQAAPSRPPGSPNNPSSFQPHDRLLLPTTQDLSDRLAGLQISQYGHDTTLRIQGLQDVLSTLNSTLPTATPSSQDHSEEPLCTPASSFFSYNVPIFPPITTTAKPRALLVDDNAINLRILQIYCKKRGLAFHCATDGQKAVGLFTKHQTAFATGEQTAPIQLVLMDLQMPVCDGVEATRQIRSLEAEKGWGSTVLCMVTGQDTVADRAAAEEAGADDYYVKPLSIAVLDGAVKKHFPAFIV